MHSFCLFGRSWRVVCCLAFLLAAIVLLPPPVWSAELVVNPYEGVDWTAFTQHRANLHTHTTESDGDSSPDVVIDKYHEMGYTILAITDHNNCTWPWQDWERDPAALGMVAIAGNEASRHHHLNSFFVDYETDSTDTVQTIEEVGAAGGLVLINHPGRYWDLTDEDEVPAAAVAEYAGLLDTYDYIPGIEFVNSFNRYPHDRALWDALLAEMMPERPVWGFANDDLHFVGFAGLAWNTFLLDSLSPETVRAAIEEGRFYSSSIRTFLPADAVNIPVINAIEHDAQAGTITISAVSSGAPLPAEACEWIANGEVVHVGPVLDYANTPGIGNYVRAELAGSGGFTFTNPFGFRVEPDRHTADQDGDGQVSLSELLRVVQFYDAGGYHCAPTPGETEDGFLVGAGAAHGCAPHASDYSPQDWTIALGELLRLVQFYNLGGCYPCPDAGSEDGYCFDAPVN